MERTIKSRPGERREQILQESLRLFAERGVFQVSTREIAKAVGISQPSLYAHFKSRDEIAIELSQRAFVMLRERMETVDALQGVPVERLRRMGREYVHFGLQHTAAYRVAFMVERANLAPADHLAIHKAGLRGFSVLHGLFKEVRKCDDLRTAALAQSTWASMHGLVSLLLARPEFPWVEQEALIELHLDRVCQNAFE
jgi:AcrR family transcriptional regulator